MAVMQYSDVQRIVVQQPEPLSYAHIQMHHFHTNYPEIHYKVHKETWDYLLNNFNKPKGLSWFYFFIHYKRKCTMNSSMANWEMEICSNFTPIAWQHAIQSYYRYSHCVTHWEPMLKVLNRSNLTPVRLSQISQSAPTMCWRQCGGRGGTVYCVLWECKSLRSF